MNDSIDEKEEKIIIGYHGTDCQSCHNILKKGGSFRESRDSDEWAGSGIYFFIEDDSLEKQAYDNAFNWSKKIKKIPQDKIKIIKVNISIDEDRILDLRDDKVKNLFHKYRDEVYKKIIESAKINNRKLKNDEKNGKIIDCTTINRICKETKCYAVIIQRYINFMKNDEDDFYHNYSSAIPNCSILSLRNQTYIIKKEDVTNDQ